jgi:hypothetical protein
MDNWEFFHNYEPLKRVSEKADLMATIQQGNRKYKIYEDGSFRETVYNLNGKALISYSGKLPKEICKHLNGKITVVDNVLKIGPYFYQNEIWSFAKKSILGSWQKAVKLEDFKVTSHEI